MDWEMLLAVVRRGNLSVRPGENVYWSRSSWAYDRLASCVVRAGEGVDRGGWLQ